MGPGPIPRRPQDRPGIPDSHPVIWDTPGPAKITTPIPPGGLSAAVAMPTVGVFKYYTGIRTSMLGSITAGH